MQTTNGPAAPPRVPPSGSSEFYVATDGRDSFEGTQQRPWATMQHAAGAVKPGATVHVGPGIYYGPIRSRVSGRPDARIRFVSEKKWAAKIVGTNYEAIWLNSGNFVDIEGFEVAGRGYIGIENDASFVTISGNYVHDLQTECQGGAGIDNAGYTASDNDVVGNVVGGIAPPRGCPAPHGQGIYQSSPRGHIWNNITYSNGRCGIHLWHAATNVAVVNNLSFNNDFGICVGAGDDPGGVVNDHTDVDNNIVVQNRIYGIFESGANGPHNRYRNNLVYANGSADLKLQDQGAATGTIRVDPRQVFLNWKADGSGDYHLKADSRAIGGCYSSAMPPYDYDGVSRSGEAACTIGPFVAQRPKDAARR